MGGKYTKDILNQLEELILDNERLTAENKLLKEENRNLWQIIKQLNDSIDERISNAVKEACTPLYERIAYLESENERKDAEITRLKAQINKDSSNSSKPPGMDGFKKVFNSREKSNKKTGGQKGHKGTTLRVPPDLGDLVQKGKAEWYVVDSTNGAKQYISEWEVDLGIKIVYTEYRYPLGTMPKIFYGNNLKTLCVMLFNIGLISEKRLSNFFIELTDGLITVSGASISKFNKEASSKVDTNSIKQDLLNGDVMHVDETYLRCSQLLGYDNVSKTAKGRSFDAVIRTHSNATATFYTINPHKDDRGIEKDGIIPSFCGILSHDHDKKYYKYGSLHATCGAHLSRELKGLHELCGIVWADKFRKFYIGMNDYKKQTEACEPDKLLYFERIYDELLCEGDMVLKDMKNGSYVFEQLRPVLTRLRKYKKSYMLFIRDYKAPFTNNQAERDLRHCKTKQKISGCFRSWNGLICYTTIRSFISTAHKRKQNLFQAIKGLFKTNQTCTARQ